MLDRGTFLDVYVAVSIHPASQDIAGRLYRASMLTNNIKYLEAIGYSPVFRMAYPEGQDPSP